MGPMAARTRNNRMKAGDLEHVERYVALHGVGQLAGFLGIGEKAVAERMKKESFAGAVERGRELFEACGPQREYVAEVEAALLKRALGHPWQEEKTVTEGAGKDRKITTTVTRGMEAPDVGAAKEWLHNRCPERWANKQTVDLQTDGVPTVVIVRTEKE